MRMLYKYFAKSDIGTYALVGLILAFVSTVIALFTTKGNIAISLLVGIGTFTLVFIYTYIDDQLGKKKHASFVYSKIFHEISDKMNFKIETLNKNQYWGLKGTYKNFFFRIYYNWNTTLSNRNIFREISIILYFAPPTNLKSSLDTFLLDNLNKKYCEKGIFKPSKFNTRFEASYIQINRGYTILTSYKDIAEQIERAIKIANTENLKPIVEKEVYELIDKDIVLHGPNIETFHNNYC